jgi:hypothetical protein
MNIGKSILESYIPEDPPAQVPAAWDRAAKDIGLLTVPSWVPWAVYGLAVVGAVAIIAAILR